MQGFAFELPARRPDGSLLHVSGHVQSPALLPATDDGAVQDYACGFSCSLSGAGCFLSPWPDLVFTQALMALRRELEATRIRPLAGGDVEPDLLPPLKDEWGEDHFMPVKFRGWLPAAAAPLRFTARVDPPEYAPQHDPGHEPAAGGQGVPWSCRVRCSWLDIDVEVRSRWPDHAYHLAFDFLRRLAVRAGGVTDRHGRPLMLRPPVWLPRQRYAGRRHR